MANDGREYQAGGQMRDVYGRREFTLRERHSALLNTDVRAAGSIFDGDGREHIVFADSAGRSLPLLALINVKSAPYNAVGDGSTDDTAAIQAAIDAAELNGQQGLLGDTVYFPPGIYKITSGLTVTEGVTLKGASRRSSVIQASSTTIDVFTASQDNVTFEDLTIRNQASGAPTAGSAIAISSGGYCSLNRMRISSFYDGIRVDSGYDFLINDAYIVNNYRYGTFIQDIASIDRGDQRIVACTYDNQATTLTNSPSAGASSFTVASASSIKAGQQLVVGLSTNAETVTVSSVAGSTVNISGTLANSHSSGDAVKRGIAGIYQESGGGLKVAASKILNHSIAYDLNVADAAATSVLCLTGNSYESQSNVSIRFRRQGTGTFLFCSVTGGEMSVQGDGIRTGAGIEDVAITGMVMKGTGGNVGVDITGGQSVLVAGNVLRQWSKGVQIASAVLQPRIGINHYRACTTTVDDQTTLTSPASSNPVGTIAHDYRRSLAGLTEQTGGTPMNAFQIDLETLRGCDLDLSVEGVVQSVGTVARRQTLTLRRPSVGNCVVGTAANFADGTAIDIVADVTTTPGSLIIGFLRNAAAGGATFDGTAHLTVRGKPKAVKVL